MKIYSRKFIMMLITYILISIAFYFGKISQLYFCGSLLAISLFYFAFNVWEKQIVNVTLDDLHKIKELLINLKKG